MPSVRIRQVLDSDHEKWVLGGIFRDLRKSSQTIFKEKPVYLPPPNTPRNLIIFLFQYLRIVKEKRVLFSSLTPLENYVRIPRLNRNQKIGLWFTHKDGAFNVAELRALKRAHYIFLHSKRQSEDISKVCVAQQVVIIAGIDPDRFPRPAIKGEKFVWAGTPAKRKNPEFLLEIVRDLPNEKFLLIGKGWHESQYRNEISKYRNLEYREFDGALGVEDFDHSDVFIVTSYMEGGPMSLMESLAAGLVPVSTDTGFVNELIDLSGLPRELICSTTKSQFIKTLLLARELSSKGLEPRRERILNLDFKRLAALIESSYEQP